MLAELVGPEVSVGGAPVDPVGVHVGEEVKLAEGFKEGGYGGPRVGGDGVQGAVWAGGGFGGRARVVLAAKEGELALPGTGQRRGMGEGGGSGNCGIT